MYFLNEGQVLALHSDHLPGRDFAGGHLRDVWSRQDSEGAWRGRAHQALPRHDADVGSSAQWLHAQGGGGHAHTPHKPPQLHVQLDAAPQSTTVLPAREEHSCGSLHVGSLRWLQVRG